VLAISPLFGKNWGMQGSSRPDRRLLDAAEFCRHLLKPDSVHAFLAEHRRRLFPDEMFEDLFPSDRGRPSVPADVIATVMVLQSLEGLSDREACRALQTDIAWKVAAGLALDSTVLDDAVQRQDTISLLQGQIRRVRKLVPGLAHIYVHEMNLDPSRPPCDFEDHNDISRVISELIENAYELVVAAEVLEPDDAQSDAVALLALVAGQDVEPGDRPGRWKIARWTAPDRIVSVVDPESRHVHKTTHSYCDGYCDHSDGVPVSSC